jgi:hypothetical protein
VAEPEVSKPLISDLVTGHDPEAVQNPPQLLPLIERFVSKNFPWSHLKFRNISCVFTITWNMSIFSCRKILIKKIVIDLQFKTKLQQNVTALIHSCSLNGNVLNGRSATAHRRKLSRVSLQWYSFLNECSRVGQTYSTRVDVIFEFTWDKTKIRLNWEKIFNKIYNY